MPVPIETTGLSKSYGAVRALQALTLRAEAGEVLGFLGPNGAGKTTAIRLLLGFLRASGGQARVFGLDCWRDSVAVRRRVGYLPGDVRLYDGLSGRGLLELIARLRGEDAGGARGRYQALAERLGLDLEKRVRSYSRGNKQKLALAVALMSEPPLLVLDEPTTALDPLIQEELYTILRERAALGATVFFSSHVLAEVEKLCHRVAVVRGGLLVQLSTVASLRALQVRRVALRFAAQEEAGRAALERAGFNPRPAGGEIELRLRGEVDPLVKLLAGFPVAALVVEPMSLEDAFLEIYREQGPGCSGAGADPRG